MRAIKYTPGTANHPTGIIELQPPEKNSAIAALYLENEEARLLMRRIAEGLGHDPQARQDIAATATLHSMGYRWSDTNQWWQPAKEERWSLIDNPDFRAAMGMQAEENTKVLRRYTGHAESIVRAGRVTGTDYVVGAGGSAKQPANATDAEAPADMMRSRAEAAEKCVSTMSALIAKQDESIALHRRLNEAMTSHMLAITLALGLDYKPEGENILPAIDALKAKLGTKRDAGLANDELDRIGAALGLEDSTKASAHFIVPAITALQLREAAYSEANDQAWAALRDHGYTPDRGETLGTLIRDAFGAESLKLSALIRDRDAKWALGRIAGVQQENSRVASIIERARAEAANLMSSPTASTMTTIAAHSLHGAITEIARRIKPADPA